MSIHLSTISYALQKSMLWFPGLTLALLLCPHTASAQSYNWSPGLWYSGGALGCIFGGSGDLALCSTPEADCASVALNLFNGPYYVSAGLQSSAHGGYSEVALCNYFYPPWGLWSALGLSTTCPAGQISDYNSPPGCAPAGPGGPQPDKRLGGISAVELDQVQDPSESCHACDATDASNTLSPLGTVFAGEPVDIASGNVFYHTVDYRTAGQNKLGFMRFYNSRGYTDGTLGSHWRSNYDRFVYLAPAAVIVERADGQKLTFTLNGSTWTTNTDLDYTLSEVGSTWTLTDPDDTVETYTTNSFGTVAVLSAIRLRNGYTQILTYNTMPQLTSVLDSYSRMLTLTYNANNTLNSVTTPDNTTIIYAYTPGASGINLTSVTWPTSPASTVTYSYENLLVPNGLTRITDENGDTYAGWTYDAYGRGLTSQLGTGADLTNISYNDKTGSRTVTNALGVTDTYSFGHLQTVPNVKEIKRAATTTTAASTKSMSYDTNGYLASVTDWNGNQTTYTNNSHGLPTTINEAVGSPAARTTTIVYDTTFVHLPGSITTPGLTTSFTYDSSGDVLTRKLTDTTSQSVPYSTNGQIRTTAYTWSAFMLASVQNPRTDVTLLTKFGYDSSGALTSITDALGHVTNITSHTAGGLPETIVDPNGVTTMLTYDPRQRLLSSSVSTSAGPRTTSYIYDAAGNLIKTTQPDNSYLANTYDSAHRVTRITDALGNYVNYTLDALADPTETALFLPTNSSTFDRTANFDALGRELKDNSLVTGKSIVYTYDKNGNRLTVSDPLGSTTRSAFDALNRRATVTDANTPVHGVTQFAYDSHNRITSAKDPISNTTAYVYDGFGDLIQLASPDGGTTKFWYDSDGNLTTKVDAAGVSVSYTYDKLDRVLTTGYPDTTLNVAYTYDQTSTGFGFGVGRLTSLTDAAGSLSRSYDERGNRLVEKRINGSNTLTTTYTYDAASSVASITYPSGAQVSYTRDATGRVTAMPFAATGADETALIAASGIQYEPFGPPTVIPFKSGDTDNYTYDKDYRTSGITSNLLSYKQNLAYSYDQADNLFSVTDAINGANTQSLRYDTLNRLTSATSGTGGYGSLTLSYDKNGNLTSNTAGGTSYTYTLRANTNRVIRASWPSNTETFGYTATGNINAEMLNGSNVLTATYSKANRLASVTGVPLAISGITYDAFGRRIIKGNPGSSTLYSYDLGGNLIEENDNGAITDYIYLAGRLVGDWQPLQHKLFFVHTDRIGLPIAATDANDLTAWQATYLPYGTVATLTGSITNNIRFPGQLFDPETSFHYNLNRDYMPTLGRYLEADPIGLAGGMNPYLYAQANPGTLTDRSGLCPCQKDDQREYLESAAKYFDRAALGLTGGAIATAAVPPVAGGFEFAALLCHGESMLLEPADPAQTNFQTATNSLMKEALDTAVDQAMSTAHAEAAWTGMKLIGTFFPPIPNLSGSFNCGKLGEVKYCH